MFWIFFFPNTLYKKSLPPPCAASRPGPLHVVAGRAKLTLGILSRSVQSAALTLRTRCFGDVVQRGRQPARFSAPIAPGPVLLPSLVQARQPRIAGAVDAPRKSLMTPRTPKQHGRRESAAGSSPRRFEY